MKHDGPTNHHFGIIDLLLHTDSAIFLLGFFIMYILGEFSARCCGNARVI
jgi:hypothetical protein